MCLSVLFINFTFLNFIYRKVLISKLIKFDTIYKNIDMLYPDKHGPLSKPSQIAPKEYARAVNFGFLCRLTDLASS